MSDPRPDRPTVLMVGPTPPPIGGVTMQVALLLNSPLAQRFELRHFNPELPPFQPGRRPPRPVRIAASLRMILQLLGTLAFRPTDLVHLHASSFPGVYEKALMAALARVLGRRTILQLHGGGFEDSWRASRAKWAIRLAMKAPHALLAVSEGLAAEIHLAVPEARIDIVPNSVETQLYQPPLPKQGGPVRILYVGWMIHEKGIFDLLEAAALLTARGVDFQLDLVGDGRDYVRFREAVTARALDDRVHTHGWQEGEAKLRSFRAADIFVLPSHIEAFGVVLLEAMSAGLPIVATRVGGIPEIVNDRVQGELVEARDGEALAGALGRLCADSALRARYGEAGLARVRSTYDIEIGAGRIAAIYDRLLSGKYPNR